MSQVALVFDRRVNASSSEFVGVNIVVSENGKNRGVGSTVLQDTDQVIGLKVDMKKLYEKSSTQRPIDSDRSIIGNKYAALFSGGAIGIVSTGNRLTNLADTELLHITMNSQVGNLPLMVQAKDTLGVIRFGIVITQNGTLSLGFNPSGSAYNAGKISQLETYGLSLKKSDATSVLYATSNVGMGVTRPSAALHLLSQKNYDVFKASTGTTLNAFGVSAYGTVYVGDSKSREILSISTNIKTAFEVSTKNVNRFYVNNLGQVRILFDNDATYEASTPYALTVSGNANETSMIMSGNDASVKNLFLQSRNVVGNKRLRGYFSAGFGAADSGKHLVFGVTSGNILGKPGNGAVNARFATNSDKLFFSNFDGTTETNVMTFVTTGRSPSVGIFTKAPSANFHLVGLAGKPILQVSTSNNWSKKGLDILESGYVHINTTSNRGTMVVSGNVLAYSIQETPSRSTLYKTVNLEVSGNGYTNDLDLNRTFSLMPTITDGKGHTAMSVGVVLDRDLQKSQMIGVGRKELAGMEVSINSRIAGSELLNQTGSGYSAYGLKVDVRDLFTEDPSFGTSEGTYASAIFTSTFGTGTDIVPDARVGIGTGFPTAPLHVLRFNGAGTLETRGEIAAFSADKNLLEDAALNYGSLLSFYVFLPSTNASVAQLNDMKNSVYTWKKGSASDINYATYTTGGKGYAHPMLTPESFETIVYQQKDGTGILHEYTLDYSEATLLQDLLRTEGVLDDVKESGVRIGSVLNKTTPPALTQSYYEVGSLFVPSASVRAVLNQYYYRTLFSFKTLDLDDATGKKIGDVGFSRTSPTYNTLIMAPGIDPLIHANGFVNSVLINGGIQGAIPTSGIASTYFFREALQVSGDMRLGATQNAGALGAPGDGAKLYFSGGPLMGITSLDDSENSDEALVKRINESSAVNVLRFSVGEKNVIADAGFTFGITTAAYESKLPADNYLPKLVVRAYSLIKQDETGLLPEGITDPAAGFVGIGISQPTAMLHIYGNKKAGSYTYLDNAGNTLAAPLVAIENTAAKKGSKLASPNSLEITYSKGTLVEGDNFMTFLINGSLENTVDSLGAIEGNPGGTFSYLNPSGNVEEGTYEAGGVAYSSPERDYAEYVEKMNEKDEFSKGDVVGVFGGKLSRKTDGAEHVMVISSTPIVVGNWQQVNLNRYALVAFLGQVPVRVKGIVHKGDYIVPTGMNDGIAIAVAPENVTFELADKVLGRSWNESNDKGIKMVNTIIGFPFGMGALETQVVNLRKSVHSLEQSTMALETELSTRYEKRQQLILDLKKQLKEIGN